MFSVGILSFECYMHSWIKIILGFFLVCCFFELVKGLTFVVISQIKVSASKWEVRKQPKKITDTNLHIINS